MISMRHPAIAQSAKYETTFEAGETAPLYARVREKLTLFQNQPRRPMKRGALRKGDK